MYLKKWGGFQNLIMANVAYIVHMFTSLLLLPCDTVQRQRQCNTQTLKHVPDSIALNVDME